MASWDDFQGVNRGYALDLYEQYRRDPKSVDDATRELFEKLPPPPASDDAAASVLRSRGRPVRATMRAWSAHSILCSASDGTGTSAPTSIRWIRTRRRSTPPAIVSPADRCGSARAAGDGDRHAGREWRVVHGRGGYAAA
jgi:hypothetical protein